MGASPPGLVLASAAAFGITIGYHRLLTHRAFETYRPIKYLLAILGSMAVQGAVIGWVADHRKHHAHTDEEQDDEGREEIQSAPGCSRDDHDA